MNGYHVMLASLLALTTWSAEALTLDQPSIDAFLGELGADSQHDLAKGVNWSVLPGPLYTPELKLGLGMAVAGVYRVDAADKTTQNSFVSLMGYVSTSGALGMGVSSYTFFTGDCWRLFAGGSVNKVPTGSWGIGYDAAQGNEQDCTNNPVSLHPVLMREIVERVYLGAGQDFSSMQTDVDDPRQGDVFSLNNAQTSPLPSGPSVSLSYDVRDVAACSQHGHYFRLEYTWLDPSFGSDTHFTAAQVQYDRYLLLDDRTVLASDLWGHFTRGDVSWDRLSMAGNDRRLRGYYQGHYRDKGVVSGQVEYRKKLNWRHGYVLWLSVGALGRNTDDMGHHPILPNTGVDYRFEVKPAMNIRLDLGFGRESAGFYFQIAEAL